MKALTPAERKTIRQRISAAISNLHSFRLYWLPTRRCVVCRSVQITRPFRVPAGAVLLGLYAEPVLARDVLADLEELLARLPEPAQGFVVRADPCELRTPAPIKPQPVKRAAKRRQNLDWIFAK